jgi:hypothetical protein
VKMESSRSNLFKRQEIKGKKGARWVDIDGSRGLKNIYFLERGQKNMFLDSCFNCSTHIIVCNYVSQFKCN